METTKQLLEQFYDRFNAGDLAGAEACFQADAVSSEPSTGEMKGSEAVQAEPQQARGR